MQKYFYLSVTVLLLLIVSISLHYSIFDHKQQKESIVSLSNTLHGAMIPFGGIYLERYMLFQKPIDSVYPEMIRIDRMEFAYER